ncbi:MAG TPA: squalene/phytoene synthase family protein [Steroidobacteraceae bacterium]|nr:squalene/phytoene synthase family protein [Steroidobacteraceae bacterium]
MDTPASANSPPAPTPGSARYFVLLYTPRPRRAALTALLAIADELAVGADRGLDHGVAHLRLQWWEEELLRFQQGAPRHPWLVGWTAALREPADLRPLAQAATIDLATQRLAARHELQLYAALFISAARLLGVPAQILDQQAGQAMTSDLETLGRAVGTFEACAAGQSWARAQLPETLQALAERQRRLPLAPPDWQPTLAPLLLWLTLSVHRWRRAERRRGAAARRSAGKSATMTSPELPGRFDELADNFIAWRYARRAMRRRFRIEIR